MQIPFFIQTQVQIINHTQYPASIKSWYSSGAAFNFLHIGKGTVEVKIK